MARSNFHQLWDAAKARTYNVKFFIIDTGYGRDTSYEKYYGKIPLYKKYEDLLPIPNSFIEEIGKQIDYFTYLFKHRYFKRIMSLFIGDIISIGKRILKGKKN